MECHVDSGVYNGLMGCFVGIVAIAYVGFLHYTGSVRDERLLSTQQALQMAACELIKLHGKLHNIHIESDYTSLFGDVDCGEEFEMSSITSEDTE